MTYGPPTKRIRTESDVLVFERSAAYRKLQTYLRALCAAVTGDLGTIDGAPPSGLDTLLEELRTGIKDYPPLNTTAAASTTRFGSPRYRDWHAFAVEHASRALVTHLPKLDEAAVCEVLPYLLGSFGHPERLDYGTGHELSFLAFLCGLTQLDAIDDTATARRILCKTTLRRYLALIRELISAYRLEPAGSHGVWGLDDHSALPYVVGAAELTGSEIAPDVVVKKDEVARLGGQSLYMDAIGFINAVKRGPFWEHSPMLYDISGVGSWHKIASGMHKLYAAEVMGKFPVVQHFPFGPELFEYAPDAPTPATLPTPSATASSSMAQSQLQGGVGNVETATTTGLSRGVGVGGAEGTVAPFANQPRTIHPRVAADMRRRGEGQP